MSDNAKTLPPKSGELDQVKKPNPADGFLEFPALPDCSPSSCFVQIVSVDAAGCKLLVLPTPAGLARMLDAAFGRFGWTCRRYACGGTLYCSVGVLYGGTCDFVHKDAPAMGDYGGRDKGASAAASSLAHAAALWGIGADVLSLPTIELRADQVHIVPVSARDGKTIAGYRLDTPLRVDKFARDATTGAILMVQLVDGGGKAIVCPVS